jgi:hypothetical protein
MIVWGDGMMNHRGLLLAPVAVALPTGGGHEALALMVKEVQG